MQGREVDRKFAIQKAYMTRMMQVKLHNEHENVKLKKRLAELREETVGALETHLNHTLAMSKLLGNRTKNTGWFEEAVAVNDAKEARMFQPVQLPWQYFAQGTIDEWGRRPPSQYRGLRSTPSRNQDSRASRTATAQKTFDQMRYVKSQRNSHRHAPTGSGNTSTAGRDIVNEAELSKPGSAGAKPTAITIVHKDTEPRDISAVIKTAEPGDTTTNPQNGTTAITNHDSAGQDLCEESGERKVVFVIGGTDRVTECKQEQNSTMVDNSIRKTKSSKGPRYHSVNNDDDNAPTSDGNRDRDLTPATTPPQRTRSAAASLQSVQFILPDQDSVLRRRQESLLRAGISETEAQRPASGYNIRAKTASPKNMREYGSQIQDADNILKDKRVSLRAKSARAALHPTSEDLRFSSRRLNQDTTVERPDSQGLRGRTLGLMRLLSKVQSSNNLTESHIHDQNIAHKQAPVANGEGQERMLTQSKQTNRATGQKEKTGMSHPLSRQQSDVKDNGKPHPPAFVRSPSRPALGRMTSQSSSIRHPQSHDRSALSSAPQSKQRHRITSYIPPIGRSGTGSAKRSRVISHLADDEHTGTRQRFLRLQRQLALGYLPHEDIRRPPPGLSTAKRNRLMLALQAEAHERSKPDKKTYKDTNLEYRMKRFLRDIDHFVSDNS